MVEQLNKLPDFGAIKPFVKRCFVSQSTDLSDLKEIKGLYESLLLEEIKSSEQLGEWLLKRSELESVLDQRGSVLYIRMSCQTDHKEHCDAYLDFIENIVPVVKPLEDSLNKKFINLYEKFPFEQERYSVYVRGMKVDIELFVQENVELEKKIGLLSQEYQALCGKQTVDFQGKEQTLPQMGKYLLETDRQLRESAWKAIVKRRLEDKVKLNVLFNEMLALRIKIAKNAGFDNYIDYKFRTMHRFDYTPKDCKKYHETVEKMVAPLWEKMVQERKRQMKLDVLRPWDTSCDPLGRGTLKPFEKVDKLINGCHEIFKNLDQRFGQSFAELIKYNLLDLESRKGKAPGGYQSTLSEARKPFIFMNAVGVDDDVRTLLHESGHAFHSLACRNDPLLDYRHGPMEFCEVASMSMELLAGKYLSAFYNEDDKVRSVNEHLEGVVYVLLWVAIVDSFQHWIYENPQHSIRQREEKWIELNQRFLGKIVDWEGFEEAAANVWHRQLHIFEVPFYYIEYAIAQIGALQVWRRSQSNEKQAIDDYLNGLSLGGSRPLKELFKAAGLRFNFSEEIIGPLANYIEKSLNL